MVAPFLKTFLVAVFTKSYFRHAIKVSLVVGSLIFLINNGEVLFSEGMTPRRWLTASLTYLVPYLVSVHGRVSSEYRALKND